MACDACYDPAVTRLPPLHRTAVILALAALGVGASPAPLTAAALRPHILLILVDDLGYGDAGCFNAASKIPTPAIDGLAAEGMRFTDAHAPGPLCHVSRYGLLTGEYPFRTDVSVWPQQPVIRRDQPTIASLLKTRGYHTAMIGKWHLGFAEREPDQSWFGGPVDCGFDSYFGIRASTDIPPYFYIRDRRVVEPPIERIAAGKSEGWSPIQGAFWREGGIAPNLKLKDVLPRFTREAIQVIEHHRSEGEDQPLFLYLALPAPHTPWLPAPDYRNQSGAGLYGDFVVMVDHMIGRVLNALKAAGYAEETLVIFTSDNGPVWYDVDVARYGHDSAGGLRGMKGDAWEAGHRMPFIVRWPGHVKANTTSAQTICFTDLFATFAAITGAPIPDGAGLDSENFLPVLTGDQPESGSVRGPLVMESARGLRMIRSGPWKLIEGTGSGGFSDSRDNSIPGPGPGGATAANPPGQLYHLVEDRGETTNRYLDHPEVVARLRSEMERVLARANRN